MRVKSSKAFKQNSPFRLFKTKQYFRKKRFSVIFVLGIPKMSNLKRATALKKSASRIWKNSVRVLAPSLQAVAVRPVSFRKKGVVRKQPGNVNSMAEESIFSHAGAVDPEEQIRKGYDFSALSLSAEELVKICVEMLWKPLSDVIANDETEHQRLLLKNLIEDVMYKYTATSYHNFTHAVDVTQMMYTVLTQYFNGRVLPHEFFFLLFSCLCHDMDHPGLTIDFLHRNGLLLEFETLEDYHIEETKTIIRSHPLFRTYFDEELTNELISFSAKAINATKMSTYQTIEEEIASLNEHDGFLSVEHYYLLMKISDLANVVRPFKDAKAWTKKLTTEFRSEGIMKDESSLSSENLMVMRESRMFAQKKAGREVKALGIAQLGQGTVQFVNDIVKPLADLIKVIDQTFFIDYTQRLENNLSQWMDQFL